ncbi:MAG: methylmalonyl-CoA mutase small subunit [Paludibacteraceae bacterium]|nr:methylmalonyl-CoA mutase small subunit [Paludibacteraceae bacterium]
MANKLNFLADFPAITTEQWMAKITEDLKGADFNKKLVWRTPEGFNVMPFYRQENLEGLQTTESAPGQFPFVRGVKESNVWRVRQNINVKQLGAADANKKALDILTKGVDSLGFKLSAEELSASYIATLLKGIDAEKVELNFKVCMHKTAELVDLLCEFFKNNGFDAAKVQGSINVDPIKRMLRKGRKYSAAEVSEFIATAVKAGEKLPKFRTVGVNPKVFCNAGVYATQELGYALAWGNQYMEMLTEAGIDAKEAGCAIKFNFGIGGNYFMEIAKFRAARLLWAKIVEAYKPSCNCAAKMCIHAVTSTFNKTLFDAHVNLLRSQTEAMSAALGGVCSMTVRPFDITYKAADDFSERIARNQQLLLKEESHFDKVVDPAAGSYYLENLTAMVAEQAWKIFLEIQNGGGFFAAVENGSIVNAVKEIAAGRMKAVASRKETLLGTNQFPNFNETAASKIEKKGDCKCKCCCAEAELETLPKNRAAEQFEALRLAVEKSGKRPKVFMLTIGNLAMRLARSQFSCNFFACAGYEVIDNLGFDTVEAGVEAARKAKADIIVLCSSDDEYATLAVPAFKAIGGKEIFVVAGAPACMEDLQKEGIENFIHVRCNVLETLKSFNDKLGI